MPLAGANNGPLLSHWPYYGDSIPKPSTLAELERADSIANSKLARGKTDTVFANNEEDSKPKKAANNLPALITYSVQPSAEHYIGIALPAMENRMAKLRAAIKGVDSQYQSQSQSQSQFQYQSDAEAQTLNQMQQAHFIYIDLFNPEHSILLIKSFPNLDAAKNYLNNLTQTPDIFGDYKPNEYQLFIISAKDYKKLLFDHNISEYLDFYNQNFK